MSEETTHVTVPREFFKRLRFIVDGIAIMEPIQLNTTILNEFKYLSREFERCDPKG